MKIFSGSAHRELAGRIAAYCKIPLGDATVDSFPDGETMVKYNENIRGRDVFLVQPTCPPTNQNLMELLIMVDAAKRASAKRITVVAPFYGYGRQDRKAEGREPITAKLLANMFEVAGAKRIISVDLHSGQIQGFFDGPVDNLTAMPVLVDWMANNLPEDLVVVSPDAGRVKVA